MHTRSETLRLRADEPRDLLRAAALLRAGGLVAFPTETVYGLGANALSPQAIEKIFEAKHRPHWDPLIVHVAGESMLQQIATVSRTARRLIDAFWPGPLTLLLPRTSLVPDAVTAGRPLVGVRMPRHPVALELIRAAGAPIAAPSANRFGHTSPTTAAHVLDDLDGRIDAVLDGGETEIGMESTVVEVTGETLILYRPGAVTAAMLESIVGVGHVEVHQATQVTHESIESLPSPGNGIRHYAPVANLVLIADLHRNASTLESSLLAAENELSTRGERVGVMLPDGWSTSPAAVVFAWGSWTEPTVLAHRLFAGLRALDDAGVATILCPLPPGDGLPAAIRDRLEKAARSK